MGAPKVSVIIPAYNSAETISAGIKAILDGSWQDLELIIVDDGSTDATASVVQSFPRVKYVFQTNAGPASARNHGARLAAGEILFFTDSDCVPESDWVRKMLDGFSGPEVSVVAGSYGIANPGSLLANIIQNEISYRHQRLMPEYPRAFGSYNFAVRTSVFRQVGGFNETYRRASGEDNDLSYKILGAGGRIRFLNAARVCHYHQTSISRYLKEQFRHGLWRVRMYADHPKMAGGDDYTFWKDIIEIPLAYLIFLLSFFSAGALWLTIVLSFLILEWWFGSRMMGNIVKGFLAGAVFFIRAFARAGGFLVGILFFSNKLISPKKS